MSTEHLTVTRTDADGSSGSARPAFTLVELLVAVGVVGVLVGVMLPALAGARGSARRGVCASNLRQVQTANALYAGDWRGHCVPGAADIGGTNLARWHGTRERVDEAFRAYGGQITPYLDGHAGADTPEGAATVSGAVRACPSFVAVLRGLQEAERGFERGCGGYGYNNAFVGTVRSRVVTDRGAAWAVVTDRAGSPEHAFGAPAETVAFGDAALASEEGPEGVVEYSFVEPRFWPDVVAGNGGENGGGRADPSLHFRHGTANVVWLDSHVSAERMTFTWSSGVYGADPAEHGIGWFGKRDDNGVFDYE